MSALAVISEKSSVQFGLVLVVLGGTASGSFWAATELSDLRHEQMQLTDAVRRVETMLGEGVTREQINDLMERLRLMNEAKDLRVPKLDPP